MVPISNLSNTYSLTMADVATKYPEFVALQTIGTQHIAEVLVTMSSRYGVSTKFLSERGSNFTSDLMKEVTRLFLKHPFTTTHHPMCSRLAERFNGTLKQMLYNICGQAN